MGAHEEVRREEREGGVAEELEGEEGGLGAGERFAESEEVGRGRAPEDDIGGAFS